MSEQSTDGANEGPLLHPSPRKLLQRMGRLVRKEVSSILRDRRTIITLVLMPLLLYPLLSIAFQQFLLANKLEERGVLMYRVACHDPTEAALVEIQLRRGQQFAEARQGDQEPRPEPIAVRVDAYPDPKPVLLQGQADVIVRVLGVVDRQGRVHGLDRFRGLAGPQLPRDLILLYETTEVAGSAVSAQARELID